MHSSSIDSFEFNSKIRMEPWDGDTCVRAFNSAVVGLELQNGMASWFLARSSPRRCTRAHGAAGTDQS